MNREEFINKIHGGLIISCQALPGEPLYTEEGGIIEGQITMRTPPQRQEQPKG